MTVVHLITGLASGGAERTLVNLLAGGLNAAGDQRVICLGDRGFFGAELDRLGVPLDCLALPRNRPSPAALPRLTALIRASNAALLQGWMYHGNLAASLAGALVDRRLPVLWNIRQTLMDLRREKPLTRWVIRSHGVLARRARAVVYNSSAARDQHRRFGIRHDCEPVIPNGVDTSRFVPDPAAAAARRRELGIGAEAKVLLVVARLHPMKNLSSFMEVAGRMLAELPDLHVLFIGQGLDDYWLRAQRPTAGAAARIHGLGEQRMLESWYPAANLLCLPSRWGEAFPNVIAEAMSCGLPCVATDLGDTAALIGDTGRVVAAADPDALQGALRSVLAMAGGERHALGLAARARICERYALDRCVARYAELYERCRT